jgi:hypothetical protein
MIQALPLLLPSQKMSHSLRNADEFCDGNSWGARATGERHAR